MSRHTHFAPAGLEIWGYGANPRLVRDANLSFDLARLEACMGLHAVAATLATPRLRFADDRLWTLVRLLAEAIEDPDPSSQLYGDGIVTAITARLLMMPAGRTMPRLTAWQLRRVLDYLETRLPERVALSSLAALTGLSTSHFSRAFKASTGTAPYEWQLTERVRRAQVLLLQPGATLDHVAAKTGFADAVHFGRIFRRLTGVTPAAWRRDRLE
jgi:AraC-like DNA-binding protein